MIYSFLYLLGLSDIGVLRVSFSLPIGVAQALKGKYGIIAVLALQPLSGSFPPFMPLSRQPYLSRSIEDNCSLFEDQLKPHLLTVSLRLSWSTMTALIRDTQKH